MHLFAAAVSPEVKALLVGPTNYQSLSKLQVMATRAYAILRSQPYSGTFDQKQRHFTSINGDLEQAQKLLRQYNPNFHLDLLESMIPSHENPPLTSARIANFTSFTDDDTDAVSSIAPTNATAPTQARAMIPSVHPAMRTYFKSHARGKLTEEEKQYRKDNNLCLYCGGEGHSSFTCPLKKSKEKVKGGQDM